MVLLSIKEVKEAAGEINTRPNIAERCGIVSLVAEVIDYLNNPNAQNLPHLFRTNSSAGNYYAKTCTTWQGGELVPEYMKHILYNEGAREHRKAYTLNTGETIKTAYITKAGAFFLVFENEETGSRRVWTVSARN